MPNSPRVRVAALIRWQNRVLLCRQEKPGKEYWLLPGGGVDGGETLHDALLRELGEELGLWDQLVFEGPIAVAESIAPAWTAGERHVVHIVFGADLSDRSLEDVESHDAAVRGLRLFSLDELGEIVLHPPMKRFVERWQPGDPSVYLGSLWIP
jgi:8-oxo-dGTP diphosphatase